MTIDCLHMSFSRVKLAVHKETQECVAVKIMSVDENGEGLTRECLRKEVRPPRENVTRSL